MDDNGLYDEYTKMRANVEATEKNEIFNWHWDVAIPAIDLDRVAIINASREAAQWRDPDPASDMYFSHGQYYGNGLEHIIGELKDKPSSNRALYSLLAQKDISGSGDRPIPSFLTFQCSIEDNILYCTASFRALEVSNFLPINLEEIRQNLVFIYKALPAIKTVHLHIFAFHAYIRTAAVAALRRPEIDVTSEARLLLLMQKGNLNKLDELLGGLRKSTTAISSASLKTILRILQMDDADLHIDIKSRRELLEPLLQQAIAACDYLAESRKSASRGVPSDTKIYAFHGAIEKLQEAVIS